MRKSVVVLASIALVALGAILGAAGMFYFSTSLYGYFNTVSVSSAVSSRVAVLKALRANDQPRAVELLESYLDGDIVSLKATMKEFPDAMAETALRRASDYRNEHPRTTSQPPVDAAVQDALGSARKGGS